MKYTPEIRKEIEENLKIGMNRTDTADIVGICYDTFCEWMKKSEFSDIVKKAEAHCKKRCISIIQAKAIDTWQAAAWWLERKHRDEFALRTELKADVKVDLKEMAERWESLLGLKEKGNGHKKVEAIVMEGMVLTPSTDTRNAS